MSGQRGRHCDALTLCLCRGGFPGRPIFHSKVNEGQVKKLLKTQQADKPKTCFEYLDTTCTCNCHEEMEMVNKHKRKLKK